MEKSACVYWDFKADGEKGGWSTDGCELQSVINNTIICHCSHLTNFAAMMVSNVPKQKLFFAHFLCDYIGSMPRYFEYSVFKFLNLKVSFFYFLCYVFYDLKFCKIVPAVTSTVEVLCELSVFFFILIYVLLLLTI